MRTGFLLSRATLLSACIVWCSSPVAAAEINGFWLTEDGEAVVEILNCNPPSQRCARIVWLKKPTGDDGRPLTDTHNPDPAQQTRPVCNMAVVLGLIEQSDGTWDKGSGYDPDDGKKYTVAAAVLGPDKLTFSGYVGIKLIGRKETWTRAPDKLRGC